METRFKNCYKDGTHPAIGDRVKITAGEHKGKTGKVHAFSNISPSNSNYNGIYVLFDGDVDTTKVVPTKNAERI